MHGPRGQPLQLPGCRLWGAPGRDGGRCGRRLLQSEASEGQQGAQTPTGAGAWPHPGGPRWGHKSREDPGAVGDESRRPWLPFDPAWESRERKSKLLRHELSTPNPTTACEMN